MERLAADDGVHGVVLERNRLRRAQQRLGAGEDPAELGEHLRTGLDGDDASRQPHERACQFAGARTEIEHRRVGADGELIRQPRDRLVRVRGPHALVQLLSQAIDSSTAQGGRAGSARTAV